MSETDQSGVKYPECEVRLVGVDPNAVAIFRKVRRELERYLVSKEGMSREDASAEGQTFQDEATSGDYDNGMSTCFRWVSVS